MSGFRQLALSLIFLAGEDVCVQARADAVRASQQYFICFYIVGLGNDSCCLLSWETANAHNPELVTSKGPAQHV